MSKLVPAWVVGKRTLRHARRLVFRLKSATDGHIPFFTSDELPQAATWRARVFRSHRACAEIGTILRYGA
jgi:hypothetical protein